MAKGIFTVNFTVEEILAIHASAKAQVTAGERIMSWGDSGVSVTKDFPTNPMEVLAECNYALRLLEPATYKRRRRVVGGSVHHNLKK